jgi:hypothetical protein
VIFHDWLDILAFWLLMALEGAGAGLLVAVVSFAIR